MNGFSALLLRVIDCSLPGLELDCDLLQSKQISLSNDLRIFS
jgi:hypothetical protein